MPGKIALVMLIVFIACLNIKAQSIYTQESIKKVMDKVNTYQYNNPWAEFDDNWIRGTYYAGVMPCYFATEDISYLDQSENIYIKKIFLKFFPANISNSPDKTTHDFDFTS